MRMVCDTFCFPERLVFNIISKILYCFYLSFFFLSNLLNCMCGHTPTLDLSVSDGSGGWSAIRGKFIAINAASMSCACPRSPKGLSPSAHLADGTTDLILVRKCSRLDFLKHLLRHTNKEDQVRVKELVFKNVFFCMI